MPPSTVTPTRKYPRKQWVLMPSFKPVKVTITKLYSTWGNRDWDQTDTGKTYHVAHLYPSKDAAITSGRAQVIKSQAEIVKRQTNLDKKVVVLDKAEQTKEL